MRTKVFLLTILFCFPAYFCVAQNLLQSVLRSNSIPFNQTENGQITFTISDADGDVQMYASEKEIPFRTPVKFVYLFTILRPGGGKEVPLALFKQIAYWNEQLYFGKIGVNESSGTVYYCSSLYLGSNKDSEYFLDELSLTYSNTISLRKEIRAFYQE